MSRNNLTAANEAHVSLISSDTYGITSAFEQAVEPKSIGTQLGLLTLRTAADSFDPVCDRGPLILLFLLFLSTGT